MSTSVFEKLISDLTVDERRKLQEKLKTQTVVSSERLTVKEKNVNTDSVNQAGFLSFFERILIFFVSLFTGVEKDRAVKDYLLGKLGKEITKNNPGFINYNDKFFSKPFYLEIEKLNNALENLRENLQFTLNIRRMDLFAFLGGWFLPEIQQRFLSETDPLEVEKTMDNPTPFEVRREIDFKVNDILESISVREKALLYSYSRSLYILKMLLNFDFTRILGAFRKLPGKDTIIGPFSTLRLPLADLYNILYSFNFPPDQELLKALYYCAEVNAHSEPEDSERLNVFLVDAERSMNVVRHFNRSIPLGDIVKMLNRNINYNPHDLRGGEDWFALYKKYWYEQLEKNMVKFISKKKIEDLLQEIGDFLSVKSIKPLDYYRNGIWGEDIGVRYENSSGILYKFLAFTFMQQMLPVLKIIRIEGKFYKEQNRIEFNDTFSALTKTPENLKNVDVGLSPGGEYSNEIQSIKETYQDDKLLIEEIKSVMEDVDNEMEIIIRDCISALTMLKNILTGITHGEIGGPYDTLSNLGFVGKTDNLDVVSSLVKMRMDIERFVELFTQVFDVERESD